MTWTKFGSEFFPKMRQRKLSDAARITHAEALAYLYNVEQDDCVFDKELLPAFAGSKVRESAAQELVARGLWRDLGESFEVLDHADVFRQSLAAQTARKQRDAAAQAKRTARARGVPVTGPETGHGTGPGEFPVSQSDSQAVRYEEEPQIPPQRTDETPAWPSVRAVPDAVDVEQARGSWRHAARGYDD